MRSRRPRAGTRWSPVSSRASSFRSSFMSSSTEVDFLAFVHPWERRPQCDPVAVRQLQQATLGSRESVGCPRIFLEKTSDGWSEIRQGRRIVLPKFVQSFGRGLTKRAPGTSRHLIVWITYRLPRFQKRRKFVRCEFTEALEVGTSRERPDADERHRLCRREIVANPRQQLNQVQLIEQVVLEPESQLVVRLVPLDHGAPLPRVVCEIQRRIAPRPRCPRKIGRPGEVPHPDVEQFGVV